MTKGNQLQTFYYNGTAFKTFSYATANGLSYSNETAKVSSKDHGKNPETEVTSSSWSFSGEMLFDAASANAALGMAQSGEAYTFAFGTISQSAWQDGLKSVTDVSTNTAWTPGVEFIRYGNGIITSFSVTANDGETATASVEIEGSGALLNTAPSTKKGYLN